MVEHLLVRVSRVLQLGSSDEVEVEVRRDGRGVVDGSRDGLAEIPDNASRAGVKAGSAEGEGFRACTENLLEDLVIGGPAAAVVGDEELLPLAVVELGPEGEGLRADLRPGDAARHRLGGVEDEVAHVGCVGVTVVV